MLRSVVVVVAVAVLVESSVLGPLGETAAADEADEEALKQPRTRPAGQQGGVTAISRVYPPGGYGTGCSCADLEALAAQITLFEEELKSVTKLEKKMTLVASAIKQLGAWVNAGVRGPRGPEGEMGLPGPLGEQGEPGEAGADIQHARTGVPGPPGYPGPAGVRGDKGERGDCIKGSKGARGRKGDAGVGTPGRRGSPGAPGEAGDPARQLVGVV